MDQLFYLCIRDRTADICYPAYVCMIKAKLQYKLQLFLDNQLAKNSRLSTNIIFFFFFLIGTKIIPPVGPRKKIH